MSFKKNFYRSFNGQNHSNQGFRQARKASLEALEPRQMLSGISFTQDNLVEDNTFQTVFGNELDKDDDSQRYVILNIKSADGSAFDAEDVKIYDSEQKEVKIISAKMENGVASILAKYTLGDSYVFVVDSGKEVDSDKSDKEESKTDEKTEDLSNMYYVHFTLAGDLDGNATVSREEYYTLQGEVSKGQGVNSRFVAMYKNIYGVDITADNFDTLYDLDGNGKITQNTFDTIIRPNYEDEIKLTQEITVVPEIDDLKVNGKVPSQTPNDEYGFATNETKDLIFSGSTRAEDSELTYTTADGKVYSGKFDFTKSGEYTLVNKSDKNDTIKLTYTKKEDGTFTLAFPKGMECNGKIELELWTDAAHSMPSNTYTFYFDTDVPELFIEDVKVKDVTKKDDGKYYVKDKEFTLVVDMNAVESATLESIKVALEDNSDGIYISVYDKNGNEVARKLLENSLFSKGTDGKLSIKDAEIKIALKEGAHTLKVVVNDLAGNVYENKSVEIQVVADQTGPTVKVDGYTANYNYSDKTNKDSMLVSKEDLTLKFTVSDANGVASVVCKNNDKTVTVKEEKEGVWTYDFKLVAGLNTIVVTATDTAGNATKQTYLVYYSEKLTLSKEGEDLQKNGLAVIYNGKDTDVKSIDLYKYFNYDDGLKFGAASSDTSVVKVSASTKGVLSFEYLKKPEEGKALTSKISVIAQNTTGESCVLTFTLNYTYSDAVTFWTETKVEKDYAKESLAKVDHIVNQDSITISGKLTVPEKSEGITLNVYRGETLIHEKLDLTKASEKEGVKYTYDSKTGAFTLTLEKLEDGKYTFKVQEVNGKEDAIQETVVYVDTEKPGVGATLETEEFFAKYPEMKVTETGTATDGDKELGLWVEVYLKNSDNGAIRYAVAKYDVKTGKFSDLEYNHDSKWLKDGTYTVTVRTVDAAGNVREEENSEKTITIDRVKPFVEVEGYEANNHYKDHEKFDSMLVTEQNLQLSATVIDRTATTVTVTNNGKSVAVQKQESTAETQDEIWVTDLVLENGLNTIIFTVVDAAGNETMQTYLVIWGDMPKMTEEGENLQKYGFIQAVVPSGQELKTLDLNTLFTHSTSMTFEVSVAENDWVKCAVSEDGILSFDYLKKPTSGKAFSVDVTVTAIAENGTEAELGFTLTYVDDTVAPVWENLTLTNNVADVSPAGVKYVVNEDQLIVTGRISDASGLADAYVDLKFGNKTYKVHLWTQNEEIDLYEDAKFTDYSFDYNPETGEFELCLYALEDDVYSLTFYAKDVQGNSTNVANGTKMENIIVKYNIPVVWAEMEVVQTGTALDRVNKNPEFTLTVTEAELADLDKEYGLWVQIYAVSDEPETYAETEGGILYAQARWDNQAGKFGELEYLLKEALPEGYWYFRVDAYDVAGNELDFSGQELWMEITTQAPEITANYEENYDSTNYGKYELSGANLDSMYLTNQDTENGIYDLGVLITDNGEFTSTMTFRYGEDGTETVIEDTNLQLQYGLNIVTVKTMNDAGNSAEKVFRIWWNDVPTVTEQGNYLKEHDFYQIVGEESTWKTLNVKELFAEGHNGLHYYVSKNVEDSPIFAEIDAETGIMSFRYTVTPEVDEESVFTEFCITAVDEFGEIVNLNFTAYYTYDNQAPILKEIELEGQPENLRDENMDVLATNHTEILVSGTLHDISGVENAQVTVYVSGENGEEKILDALNMLQSSSGETLKTGISYEYVYSATGNGVTLRLYNADGTPIAEVEYRLEIAGADSLGNDSVSGNAAKQVFNILVDRTEPSVEATITLQKTGESENRVNSNPKFDLAFQNVGSEHLWVLVTVEKVDTGEETGSETPAVLYAMGKIVDGKCSLTYEGAQGTGLQDGTYTFRFTVTDVAGNTQVCGDKTVTIDRVIPELNSIQVIDCERVEGTLYDFVTHNSTVKFVPLFAENTDADPPKLYYCFGTDGKMDGEPTLYDSAVGVSIDMEKVNEIYFWGQDTANNRTTVIPLTIMYREEVKTPVAELVVVDFPLENALLVNLLSACKPGTEGNTLTLSNVTVKTVSNNFTAEIVSENNSETGAENRLLVLRDAEGMVYYFTLATDSEAGILRLERSRITDVTGKTLTGNAPWNSLADVQLSLEYTIREMAPNTEADTDILEASNLCIVTFCALEITSVPEWKAEIPLEENVYVWSETENETGVYSLELAELIQDSENSELTFMIDSFSSTGNLEIDAHGKLTFTAPEASYVTDADGLSILISAKSSTIENAQTGYFSLRLVIQENTDTPEVPVIPEVFTVTDASLNPYDYENVTGTLTESVEIYQKTEINATVATGSTLTAGTVLTAGTSLSMTVASVVCSGLEMNVDYRIVTGNSMISYLLLRDVEITSSITTDTGCSNVSVSVIGKKSVLATGTVLEETLTTRTNNIEKVEKIYQDYKTNGTLLEMVIPAETLGNLEIESVTVQNLPENHAIQSISLKEDGSLSVKYLPYQVTQDRSPITVNLLYKSGTTVDFSLVLPYEKPFEIKTTLTDIIGGGNVSELPASQTEINADGGTYYLTFWLQCNLPTYSEDFVSVYATYALTDLLTLYVNAEAATEIMVDEIGGGTTTAVRDGDFWKIEAVKLNTSLLGGSLLAADGNWSSLASFKMTLTGTASLDYRIEQKLEIGFPFEYNIDTKEGVGVMLDTVTASQITGELWGTILVAQTMPIAVASLMSYTEDSASIADTGVVMDAVDLENIVRTDSLTGSATNFEMETETKLQSVAEKIAVESYFGDVSETLGCTTAVASGIVEESELLKVVQESESVQNAARELTDGLFAEEDFYLASTEKE